jgi:hypothetical protein
MYLITVSFIFRSFINVYAARTGNPKNAFCAKTSRKNVQWQDNEKEMISKSFFTETDVGF